MAKDYSELSDGQLVWWWIQRIGGAGLVLTLLFMWGLPQYSVYQQNLEGEAELARATQNRQIAIQEAQAKKEAAHDLAAAEIIRAEGVAKKHLKKRNYCLIS